MEFNNMNLDELLNMSGDNTMTGKLFTSADVEVTVTEESDKNEEAKEETQVLANNSLSDGEKTENKEVKITEDRELTKAEFAEINRKKAMEKLEAYEAAEKTLSKLDGEMSLLNQELDSLISKIKLDNKDLIDKINAKANEIEAAKAEQDKIKEELLPLQREVYLVDNEDKTLKFNKVQSTYVAPTEKNQFDLKSFREEQKDFWKENLDILKPYSKITPVSDYVKITISKK